MQGTLDYVHIRIKIRKIQFDPALVVRHDQRKSVPSFRAARQSHHFAHPLRVEIVVIRSMQTNAHMPRPHPTPLTIDWSTFARLIGHSCVPTRGSHTQHWLGVSHASIFARNADPTTEFT